MGIGVDLPGNQSFSGNASTKGALPTVNCSNTADFKSNMTKFQHGVVHVGSCLMLHVGCHGSIQYATQEKTHLNRVLLALPSNSLLLVTPYMLYALAHSALDTQGQHEIVPTHQRMCINIYL